VVGQRLPGVIVNDIAQQQCLDWRPAKGGFLAEPLNAGGMRKRCPSRDFGAAR